MKKKNRLFRITSLLLVLCFVSTAMISGTFAKYTSEYSGLDTALIAKWEITPTALSGLDGEEVTLGDDADLNLFEHAYDTNIVEEAGTDKIIAPGVEGEFTLKVANTGDVAAAIEFEFEVDPTSVDAPIQYSLDSTFADIVYVDGLGDKIEATSEFDNVEDTDGTDTITVYWRWPHDVSEHVTEDLASAGLTGTGTSGAWTDADDTALGEASAAAGTRTEYILNVTATATQLEPGDTL